MNAIRVSASGVYDVLVERALLNRLGTLAKERAGGQSVMLVSDDAVYPLYGARAEEALQNAGYRVWRCVIPHGEQHKNLTTYTRVLTTLYEAHITRGDLIVALGGGVVGDLAGFSAATYLRGVRYIQVPTTLLAMVDSSVGGKTAVDLGAGKNQVGCFYQPALVLCDPSLLATLPEKEYRCGCAEVIKYGVLGDAAFFESLRQTPVSEQLEQVISACVTMKRDVVEADEFDRGRRQLLNLGHSIGHAVEACSGFTILHGQGVSIGMAVITRAAVRRKICAEETLTELLSVLRQYRLPTETDAGLDELARAALADKKMDGGTMHLIVPEAIGRCRIEVVPAAEVRAWMRDGGIV